MRLEILSQYAKNEDNCKRGAIVFVHGAYQGAWCWEEFFMPYFSRIGYDCYALSLRGHGKSDGFEKLESFTLSDYVADVNSVFIKKQLDSAILVGHSFGGAIVQLFLEQFPEKVEKMVLISSIPPTGMLFDMGHFALRHPWKFLKLGTINFRKNIHSINDVGSLFLSNKISLTKRKEYCEKIQKDSIRTNITTLKPIVSKNFNPSVSVLVLGSKFDIMLTRSAIRKTAEFYHGKIVMFDDLTHDMMLDPEWKKVAIVIENFLR